jgi:hypothetical protein
MGLFIIISILIVVLLIGSVSINSNIFSLVLLKQSKLGTEGVEMESGDFLIKNFREFVDSNDVLVSLSVLPELELSQCLVGEGAAHHKRGVSSSASEVQ